MKKVLKNNAFQSLLSSIICVILGLLIGYVVLLFINPEGAKDAITAVIKGFFYWPEGPMRTKYLSETIVYTVPLLMCSLSILFSYKVGLFNIGCAGQYVAGAGIAIYSAIAWQMPWYVCVLLAAAAGSILGAFSGALKAYRNVNEVISGIMLNWIGLYVVNMLLSKVQSPTAETFHVLHKNPSAVLPTMGLDVTFNYKYFTIAVPIAIIIAIAISIILNRTKFGYELRATGNNKNAAKYAGMKEKRNIIVTLIISGALAGLGAALFFLTDIKQWEVTQSSVPAMGFNGIAAAFLGCLDPIGAVISSFFIQHITYGGSHVNLDIYCSQISDLISSIIIYLCGFVLFFKYFMNNCIDKSVERKAARKKNNPKVKAVTAAAEEAVAIANKNLAEAEASEEEKAELALPVEENTDGGDEK